MAKFFINNYFSSPDNCKIILGYPHNIGQTFFFKKEIFGFQDINPENPEILSNFSGVALSCNIAESVLRNYYCDKLFLGIDSLNIQKGITTPT